MPLPRSLAAVALSLLLHAGLLSLLALHASDHRQKAEPPVTIVTLAPPPAPVAAPEPAPLPAPAPEPERPPPPKRPPPAKRTPPRTPPPKPTPAKPAAVKPAPTPEPASPAPLATAPPAPSAPANLPAPAAAPAPAAPPAAAPPAATGVSIPASYAASNRKPVQPPMSRRYGEQGTVVLRVQVKADGNAGAVEVRTSSGFPMLDEAAREAVQTWRFIPATRDGRPVTESYLVPVTFTLRN